MGNDIFGKQAFTQFEKEGIDTSFVMTDAQQPSGVALITIDSKGENTIVVASGANGTLLPEDVQKAKLLFWVGTAFFSLLYAVVFIMIILAMLL